MKKNNDTYEICNFQYSRGYQKGDSFNEYSFSTEDIRINFELLKETIENIRTKFYINWVNVVPILLEEYHNSKIYKNTVKYYLENNLDYENNSLPFAEFYDTIINDLYLNTLDFKWLLFEKNVKGNTIMYLDILNDIYPVYNILNDIEGSKWLLLDENKQTLFTKNMDLYISKIQKGESYNNYPNELLKDFFIYMMTFFDTKYNFISDVKGYNKVISYTLLFEDINEDNLIDKSIIHFENYKLMNKFYLYDFIRSQILKIHKSWYGYKIFKNKKIVKLEEYNTNSENKHRYNLNKFDSNFKVSYKNIYNFSKSLYLLNKFRENTDDYKNDLLKLTIPTNFNSLNIEIKDVIKNLLKFMNEVNIVQKYKDFQNNKDLINMILKNFNIRKNIEKNIMKINLNLMMI